MIKKRSMVATVESLKTDFVKFGSNAAIRQIDINLGDQTRIRCNEGDALFDSVVKSVRGGCTLSFDYADIREDKKTEALISGGTGSVGSGWFTVHGVEITDAKPGEISKLLEERLEAAAVPLSFPEAPREIVTGKTKGDIVPEYKAGAHAEASATGDTVEKF
jgi:hypothetical protein